MLVVLTGITRLQNLAAQPSDIVRFGMTELYI